ncbi:hypothetical protein GL325_12625 [Aeromicrobium sp. 636]|uniref:Uncharacterized protein n=1 Tax=Aeromicrobium senzhongii TaxID=2663859 RepID=A0A8I0K3B9_9ACTN|nr:MULTISPECIES: hypothetical protein [Aeromicrobium]MBC9227170.1 hypothetical protein [Aeromicrobium senzhongii]MCQ3999269.1 hypothetical protein [Aeromicrobium sp. 636]
MVTPVNDDTAKTGAAVPHLDETFLQLTVGYDDLLLLAEVHAGTTAPGDVPARLRQAGLVGSAGLNPTAAGLVEVAVAPARSVVVERFDGSTLSPMFIGWLPDGRATTSAPDAEGAVVVTATEFGLLRDQLRQWLGIFHREVAGDRQVVTTDTTVLDAAVSARGVEPTGDAALDAIIENWRLAWRANGNWAQRGIDAGVTIVDAGGQGWYRVDHPPREGAEPVDVTLVPLDLEAVLAALGDVVTGRAAASDD